jgi:hypothetical protein
MQYPCLEVTAALEDSAAVHRAKTERQLTPEEFDALSADFVAGGGLSLASNRPLT